MVALSGDGEAPASVTRENYNALMKKVQALSIDSMVESLTTELRKVDTALTKRETATQQAAAQQQAEQAAQAAASENNSSASSGGSSSAAAPAQSTSEEEYVLSPNTPTNTNNQPIIPARQSDLDDVNNSAWVWADGVQEKSSPQRLPVVMWWKAAILLNVCESSMVKAITIFMRQMPKVACSKERTIQPSRYTYLR